MTKESLSRDAIRRILLSHITIRQNDLIKRGVLDKERALAIQVLGCTDSQIDMLEIDEGSLGFDSLSRLDLVLFVNQFFLLHTTGVEDYLLIKRRIGDWVDIIGQHFALSAGSARIAFQTSGSTGKPKTVVHDLRTLQTEVKALLAAAVDIEHPNARIISLVPPHHIFGFVFSCLLPSMNGNETLSLYQQTPTCSFAVAKKGDVVIATPFIWDKLVQSGLKFRAGVTGITSAAPSTAATWTVLDKLALSGLTEVYGATETGGIGYRTAHKAAFALLPHLERTHQSIRQINTEGDALELQDRLVWVGEHQFKIIGRHDHVVQVAGVNVSPAHVARVIGSVAGVKEADVRIKGDRLQALIVPMSQNEPIEKIAKRIRNHISLNLPPPARPSTITFGQSLPYTDMGKVVDWT